MTDAARALRARGSGFGGWLHRDPELFLLRGIPDFDGWITPRQ
jgi:hypothetical protein